MYLHQDYLLPKINEYLIEQGKSPIEIVDICLGLSKIWAHLSAINKEDLFWQYRQSIAKFGTHEFKPNPLITEFITAITQFQRGKYYDWSLLIGHALNSSKKLETAWNFSKSELIDFLTDLIDGENKNYLANCAIFIYNFEHVCTLTYRDNVFSFYDPHLSKIVKSDNLTTLVDTIYLSLGKEFLGLDGNCPLRISITQMVHENTKNNYDLVLDDKNIYKKFLENKINQFEIGNISTEDFKIWVFYNKAIGSSISTMLANFNIGKYDHYCSTLFVEQFSQRCNLKLTFYDLLDVPRWPFLNSWVRPHLFFDVHRFATTLELNIRRMVSDALEKDINDNRQEINNISTYYNATPLMQAAYLNKYEAVVLLLKYGADVNAMNDDYLTALHFAVLGNNPDICKLLLESGADPNSGINFTPLSAAVKLRQLDICNILLDNKVDPNKIDFYNNNALSETVLHHCHTSQGVEMCKLLLEHGADPNILINDEVLSRALESNLVEVVKLLLELRINLNVNLMIGIMPALHVAIYNRCPAMVDLFLFKGANIHAKGEHNRTALHIAAINGICSIGIKLIKCGAEINVVDENGYTPLGLAVLYGRLEFCRLLLNNGADPNLFGLNTYNLVSVACLYDHKEIANLLIENGADPNIDYNIGSNFPYNEDVIMEPKICNEIFKFNINKNKSHPEENFEGNKKIAKFLLEWEETDITALHVAAYFGLKEVCKILLERGKNINAISKYYNTPLYQAVKGGRNEIVDYLLENKANPELCGYYNRTPLLVAVELNYKVMIKSLLEHNAYPDVCYGNNLSPIEVARQYGNYGLLALLDKKFAKSMYDNTRLKVIID